MDGQAASCTASVQPVCSQLGKVKVDALVSRRENRASVLARTNPRTFTLFFHAVTLQESLSVADAERAKQFFEATGRV